MSQSAFMNNFWVFFWPFVSRPSRFQALDCRFLGKCCSWELGDSAAFVCRPVLLKNSTEVYDRQLKRSRWPTKILHWEIKCWEEPGIFFIYICICSESLQSYSATSAFTLHRFRGRLVSLVKQSKGSTQTSLNI